jgi:hypothetical protein
MSKGVECRPETRGDKPGWIYNHNAILSTPDEIRIIGGEILSLTYETSRAPQRGMSP